MSSSTKGPTTNERHLAALPAFPSFQQDSSSIDGLLPSCRVASWQEFMEVMRHPDYRKASSEMIFRGQRGCAWPLSSTLGRKFNAGSIPPAKRATLLTQFELAMRGRGYDLSVLNSEVEKWAIGQHHGLYTPLLDWTRSPFVALFFAFNRPDGPDDDNPSRAVFGLNMSAIYSAIEDEDLFVEPRNHNNARLVNQAGLFTLTPSGEDNIAAYVVNRLLTEEIVSATSAITTPVKGEGDETEFEVSDRLAQELSRFIFKIHIPNIDRSECLDMLRKMNIHNGSLFPDAQGASLYCNDWLERLIDEEVADRAAVAKAAQERVVDSAQYAVMEGEATDLVAALLKELTGEVAGPTDISGLAERIDETYQTASSFDWPHSDSKTAKVRTSVRRVLATLGFPSEHLEGMSRLMLKLG